MTLLVSPQSAAQSCTKCGKATSKSPNSREPHLEHGFSHTSHHGPEPSGGTAAADECNSRTAETTTAAAATTPAAGQFDNVKAHKHENVKAHRKNTWIPENQYRKQKQKLKKQKINVVFNYSDIELTAAMENVLNKGLKFAVLPLKLDIAQILTDFRRFERTMLWKEFWFGKDSEEAYNPPMFKKRKQNFPSKHTAPRGLRDCLAAVKSEIADPKNRRRVVSNIKEDEKEALHKLVRLQKERQIVIKPCDKGAGIIILNFNEYMTAALVHLEATTATGEKYYKKVNDSFLKEAKQKITNIVQEAYDNEILSKEEFSAMLPPDGSLPVPGRFYCTFKVHKEHVHGKAH